MSSSVGDGPSFLPGERHCSLRGWVDRPIDPSFLFAQTKEARCSTGIPWPPTRPAASTQPPGLPCGAQRLLRGWARHHPIPRLQDALCPRPAGPHWVILSGYSSEDGHYSASPRKTGCSLAQCRDQIQKVPRMGLSSNLRTQHGNFLGSSTST